MEIEMKFMCNDLNHFKKKAITLDFKFEKLKHQIDYYFIVGKKVGSARDYLRIREDKINNTFSFDCHRALALMENEEIEISLTNKKDMMTIMERVGQKVVCIIDKKREEYVKDNVHIVFDKVKNLGNFIEVEIIGSPSKKNKKVVLKTAEDIGLSKKDYIPSKGYPDLLLEKK